ncbi:MAG TPA: NAD(P)H-dependent glycerol-3-phosphate dehydrogenase [Dissulfurispiraceae bacterium]|nr:NAD(P)H-dependent glycerol-3-phosphate dehydrogenase [Dissulfurispiraceae bacterium]
MSYIAVIGAGSWGTTLASLLSEKGYEVTLWTHVPDLAVSINKERMNSTFLPGFKLPPMLNASFDGRELSTARYILNTVPTQFIRTIFNRIRPHMDDQAIIVSASKGIENSTLLTPSMILGELLGRPVSVLSGPSFAREVADKKPAAVTLATGDPKTGLLLQEIFNTDYFRVYTHDDITGVEIGGALKNVIAIAAGICDGLGLGHNSRAALITRGLSEIIRLGLKMGANEVTFSGLSGIGDLVLTCTDMQSRNFTVGHKLGKGMKLADIISRTQSVAEGIATTLSARQLAARQSIEMPIIEQVYLALYEGKSPADAVRELMNRSLKSEFQRY